MADKVHVRVKEKRNIHIHNDLANAAYYFNQRIKDRIARDDREGVGLEIIAGLVMSAFELEAKINFVGFKMVENWDEWKSVTKKLETVCSELGVNIDWSKRPFSSIKDLKNFRDTLAHGKPLEVKIEEEILASHDELEARGLLEADWEKFVTQEFLELSHKDVGDVWQQLLEASKMNLFETLTHGNRSISLIEGAGQ